MIFNKLAMLGCIFRMLIYSNDFEDPFDQKM